MNMQAPTAAAILSRWTHTDQIAEDLGIPRIVPRRWRERNSIPGEYDLALLASAQKRSLPLSLEDLAIARAYRPKPITNSVTAKVRKITGANK